jgi:hypothetical protein
MRKLLVTALLVVLVAGCGEQRAQTPPAQTATATPELDEHGHDISKLDRKSLSDYSQGVRDYYGDTVPVGKTGDELLDVEVEYHQPPDPAEAPADGTITLTGTNIGVRLKVTVDEVEDLGDATAVHLRLYNTGIAVHDDAFREAALTYDDGKTVKIEGEKAKCSNGFNDVVRIDALRRRRGCLVFAKSGDARPERSQLALENVPVEAGGIWNLTSR